MLRFVVFLFDNLIPGWARARMIEYDDFHHLKNNLVLVFLFSFFCIGPVVLVVVDVLKFFDCI